MRLLNSPNAKLEDFRPDQIATYAILSHIRGEDADEVSFADMILGGGEGKAGHTKI